MTRTEGNGFVVAIDGPAGAGKSTVARGLADRLNYVFLDTGALYRTVAWVARSKNTPWDDGPQLAELVRGLDIAFATEGKRTCVFANGNDVTDAIRRPEISQGASCVSAIPEVRAGLLETQRRVALKANVVAEGRDTGTVVFPFAQAKFFLLADPEIRARRRTLELQAAGRPVAFEEVLAEMRVRDARDSERAVAPLRPAPDAITIDSSGLAPEAVIEQMAALVRARGG